MIKKKKGSALILVIAVTALLAVLSTSLLVMAVSSYKNNVAYDNINRINIFAEAGIEKALTYIRTYGNIGPAFNFKSDDETLDCNVIYLEGKSYNFDTKLYEDKEDKVTIESTATNQRYSKTIRVVLTKKVTNTFSPFFQNMMESSMNVLGNSSNINLFANGSKGNLTIYGESYFRGNNIDFAENTIINGHSVIESPQNEVKLRNIEVNGDLYIKSNTNISLNGNIITKGNFTALAKQTFNIDNNVNITADGFGFIKGNSVNLSNGATFRLTKDLYIETGNDINFNNNTLSVSATEFGVYGAINSIPNVAKRVSQKTEPDPPLKALEPITDPSVQLIGATQSGFNNTYSIDEASKVATIKIKGRNYAGDNFYTNFQYAFSQPNLDSYFKVIIVDGEADMNFDRLFYGNEQGSYTFNNYIIFCTEKFVISNMQKDSLTFNNSVIYSKAMEFVNVKNDFAMTIRSISNSSGEVPFTSAVQTKIDSFFKENLVGYESDTDNISTAGDGSGSSGSGQGSTAVTFTVDEYR